MRVRADGNDFSAQLTISGQNLPAGIGLRKAVGQAAAVALDALPMFNHGFDHLVDDRSVPVIVVEAVRAWGVADDVVQMTVHVKTGPETADSLQGNSKKSLQSLICGGSLPERGVVWIHPVHIMAGANDKVKAGAILSDKLL